MVEHSAATVRKDTLPRKRRCAIFVGMVTGVSIDRTWSDTASFAPDAGRAPW